MNHSITLRRMFAWLAATACLLAAAAGYLALASLSIPSNMSWAQGLWDKEHFLNFGGNPAEVYSHLLNLTVALTSALTIVGIRMALSLFATPENGPSLWQNWLRLLPFLICAPLALWAIQLDSAHGEGTTGFSICIFFLPILAGIWSGLARIRFEYLTPIRAVILYTLYTMAVVAVLLFAEPSGTGGPNLLIIPGGILLVAVTWLLLPRIVRRLNSQNRPT